jgi:Ala-tRNA(Pro) deacylase
MSQPVSGPATDRDLFAHLAELGIETRTVEHDPVFTVEEAKRVRGREEGAHIKNLLLRNKKGAMWLVVVDEDRRVDLKALAARLEVKNLSFASADRLMKYLGVIPGAVTPFGVINDREGVVRVMLDAKIFERDPIHCHPLRNDRTTAIAGADLLRFLRATGHEPAVLDLD